MSSPPPSVRREPDARHRIRRFNRRTGRRIVVLDDDPTGSQSVQAVDVLLVPDRAAYRDAPADPGDVTFILTNTRGLTETAARTLTREIAADVVAESARMQIPIELISRSDSCLRGHVIAEIDVLRTAVGNDVDGVLFVPALFQAGRYTRDDVHYAVVDGVETPVGQTEFARDPTFGYVSSHLPTFLQEKSGGAVRADHVLSVSLEDIRIGGPDAVAAVLEQATDSRWIVVNALVDEDLDVVVLGLQQAQASGRRFLYRTGPSFVRALAGIEPRPALTAADVARRPGHGLVIVGSHTAVTTTQLDHLHDAGPIRMIELDVPTLLRPSARAELLSELVADVRIALRSSDVVVATSRAPTAGRDPIDSLAIARSISAALVRVAREVRDVRPAWVVAKGGITSHDIAVSGLGITRATVVGQFAPGSVSLLRPVTAPEEVVGMPFVVFPGNTGAPDSLTGVVRTVRGEAIDQARGGPLLARTLTWVGRIRRRESPPGR